MMNKKSLLPVILFCLCASIAVDALAQAKNDGSGQQPQAYAPPQPAAQGQNNSGSNVHMLPTAEKTMPAAPTTQPSLSDVKKATAAPQAAPTTQPVIPQQYDPNNGLGSVQTQIQPMPLPQQPTTVFNPNEPLSQGSDTGAKPYLPPQLRDKATPQSNIMLPPLYGWQNIVLNELQMPQDKNLITDCNMKEDMIFSFFGQRLQEGGIPVINKKQAARMVPESVVVNARPIIVSMQDLVINCTSWVQFQVTADVTFRVPPLMYRRTVPLMLWHDGMLVTSAKSTHNGALINAFLELAMRFRRAWDAQQAMIDKKLVIH